MQDLGDIESMRRFAQLELLDDAIPDETTILKFRHMIERHTLSEAILFEDRGPRCTLIVFIDDTTSELMALRFAPAETTQAYMETLRAYLAQHGQPVAFYSDKRQATSTASSG